MRRMGKIAAAVGAGAVLLGTAVGTTSMVHPADGVTWQYAASSDDSVTWQSAAVPADSVTWQNRAVRAQDDSVTWQ